MKSEIERALSFHKQGNFNKAENLYLDLLKNSPKDASLLQLLGTLYLQKENFEKSKRYLEESYKINSNNSNTLNNLGNLEKKLNNYKKASEYFQINIDKNNFLSSWINKSNIFIEEEQFEEGLIFIEKAISKFPNDVKLRNNMQYFYLIMAR